MEIATIHLRLFTSTATSPIAASGADCSSSAASSSLLRPQPREAMESSHHASAASTKMFYWVYILGTWESDTGVKICWLGEAEKAVIWPSSSTGVSEREPSSMLPDTKLWQPDVPPFYFLRPSLFSPPPPIFALLSMVSSSQLVAISASWPMAVFIWIMQSLCFQL